MGPDSRGSPSDGPTPESRVDADGATGAGVDEARLYRVVHAAVKDALLDVIGTLLLVGIAFVLVVAGGQAIVASVPLTGGASASLPGIVAGLGVVTAGLYLAAATLEIVPPIREWF